MIIKCGPESDRRILKINLPTESQKIGVLVSGGLDSAILYHLVMQENKNIGNLHKVLAYTVLRTDGSKTHALSVIRHVSNYFSIPQTDLIAVGDNSLPQFEQVTSGLHDIWENYNTPTVYVGVIESLPIHAIRKKVVETHRYKIPMQPLNKSHVVDLVSQFKQEALFELTHACDFEFGRCAWCPGCLERQWGFDQNNIVDPGNG